MSKATQNKLIPKLRFAEFINDSEWEEIILGEIVEFTGGGTPTKTNESFWQGNIPWVSSSDLDEESIFKLNISRFISNEALKDSATKKVPPNSILVVSRVGVGKIAISKDFICTSQDFTNITPKNDNLIFLAYQLKSKKEILLSFCQGMAIKGFTKETIEKLTVYRPRIKEQQKIAACLSSLDDLITAENQKLETLKAHKNGLLQNLFPVDGETLPKLRFKEFEGSGEWTDTNLGKICNVLMCKRIFAEETNEIGGVPFYKIGTLGGKPDSFISRSLFEEYKTKYNYPKKGEILITCSGTVGKCLIFDGKDAYYQDSNIVWLDNPTLEISNVLLYYIVSNVDWSKLNSTTITRIYGSDLRELKIKYPKNIQEQIKIASSLISIDEILSNQTLRIEILKKQKKGLLEGLFPTT